MGEQETMSSEETGRVVGGTGGGAGGLAIGDQATTENPHSGSGGGGGVSHGHLFPQGGGLPTHPETVTPTDLADDGSDGRKGLNAINVKLA